ncbi:MAG: hypothetical protein ACE5E6_10505 [Phycisphaerae bacterium]
MPETELHQTLKRAACRWLWDAGYAAIAEEVRVPGVGVVDVAAAGRRRRRNPRRAVFAHEPGVDRRHVVFVECKALRADFVRDRGRQHQFTFALGERARQLPSGRPYAPRHASQALGKFDTCLLRPHANMHYLLTPPGLVRLAETPRRWGLLVWQHRRVRVVRKAGWQEVSDTAGIEAAIAQALTARCMRLDPSAYANPVASAQIAAAAVAASPAYDRAMHGVVRSRPASVPLGPAPRMPRAEGSRRPPSSRPSNRAMSS